MTASQSRPRKRSSCVTRSPRMVSTSGKRPGLVLPRLKRVTVCPAARAASTIGGPTNPVPPRTSILLPFGAGTEGVTPVGRGDVGAPGVLCPDAQPSRATLPPRTLRASRRRSLVCMGNEHRSRQKVRRRRERDLRPSPATMGAPPPPTTTTPESWSFGSVPLHGAPCWSHSMSALLSEGAMVLPRGMSPDDTSDCTEPALACTVQQEDHVVPWHPEQ